MSSYGPTYEGNDNMSEWDEYATDWDSDPSVQEYSDHAFKSLQKVVSLNGLRVLDFGCGTGALTQKISPLAKSVVAIDSSSKMIQQLKNKQLKNEVMANVQGVAEVLSTGQIKDNPLFLEKFDLVVASSVCAFLPQYEATVCLLKALLKPNGIFVQWDWLAETEGSDMGLTQNEINAALSNNGFVNVDISKPFELDGKSGTMQVVMASAKKL